MTGNVSHWASVAGTPPYETVNFAQPPPPAFVRVTAVIFNGPLPMFTALTVWEDGVTVTVGGAGGTPGVMVPWNGANAGGTSKRTGPPGGETMSAFTAVSVQP